MRRRRRIRRYARGWVFIGTKLISIIAIVVLVSLGSVTALVSYLLRRDMQIATEENNVEVNRRAAMETESALANIRSHSRLLILAITATGAHQDAAQNAIDFFFEENPQIAAVFFTAGVQNDGIMVNSRFFRSREIDEALANSYRDDCAMALRRAAAGETLILNAAPRFIVPVLALFFPWNNGGAGVLFSSAPLDNVFCFGDHQSYLLNDSGDILIHADFALVRDGVNVTDSDFTRYVRDNQERNSRTRFTDEDGIPYFRAFTKLNIGGCAVITGIEYDNAFEGMAAAQRTVFLCAGVLFVLIMLVWFFAKSIFILRNKEELK